MSIRTNTYPGQPWRLRGPVPLAPEPAADAGGAAAKPAQPAAQPAATEAAAKTETAAPAAAAAPASAPAQPTAAPPAAAASSATPPAPVAPQVAPAKSPEERLKRFDELEKSLDEKARAIDAKTSALEEKFEKARQKAVLSTLRRLGADPDVVTDADLLLLAPKGVDPDGPTGLAELKKFRDGRPGFFKRADVGPQEHLAAFAKRTTDDKSLSERQKERRQRMANKLLGGDR